MNQNFILAQTKLLLLFLAMPVHASDWSVLLHALLHVRINVQLLLVYFILLFLHGISRYYYY